MSNQEMVSHGAQGEEENQPLHNELKNWKTWTKLFDQNWGGIGVLLAVGTQDKEKNQIKSLGTNLLTKSC